jgi:hypothetical protein
VTALRNRATGEIVTDDYACFVLADNAGYETVPDAKVFDPGEHSVADVQAYLEQHPEDADRVLAAERDGKNRKSIMSGSG